MPSEASELPSGPESRDLPTLEASQPQGLKALLPGVYLGRTSIEPMRRLPSQLDVIDDLLAGGLPRGRVSELVGPQSSGKTSLLVAFLAAATRRSEVTAYVDLANALSPASFVAAGVDLEHLLWVRPPSLKEAVRCAEIILQAGGFAAVALDLDLPPSIDHRLPVFRLNVWPRLARAAEQSHASLIVLAPQRLTGSVATLGIEMHTRPLWRRGLWSLFDGFEVSVTVARSKLGPPGRSAWLRVGIRESWSNPLPGPPPELATGEGISQLATMPSFPALCAIPRTGEG